MSSREFQFSSMLIGESVLIRGRGFLFPGFLPDSVGFLVLASYCQNPGYKRLVLWNG